MLWYNRFEPQNNADWFVLVGIYVNSPTDVNALIKASECDMSQYLIENRVKKIRNSFR